ncbi:preprotein translocase subunit SecE [Mycoplasma sp. NEAQ87857]|uniref:preprotein translocase subunit SecE n=1 Tax=Mycoplasma sp. NEAQ87857 TaxID=2683967 RepID=UPI001E49903F|nr:preprotein translocase subunit SecE [Mycoplasma sp. NEAQ87857]
MKKDNQSTEVSNKKEKRKKWYFFRKVAKDIKRVRWPDAKTNTSNFIKIIVFTVLFALFVFAITFGFTHLWNHFHIT